MLAETSMKPASSEMPIKATQPVQLNHILTSAVVLNWDALTSSGGRVRLEYHVGADGSLDDLKMWGSAREYWSLICAYSVNPGWSDGPRFSNGFHSRALGRMLQAIMMNQSLFRHDQGPNSNGLLEIGVPSLQDCEAARVLVNDTFQRPA